ncbi:protein kinase domain-containing protein [Aquisphaera insulae]|uniref:protein kinase domain-containing protein n=1 Tax=Aquisphaera insulae TaxID=2712864 RepID=UPI0013EA59FF|nr:protein kinase [Aquisphaera insulae]
MSFAATCPDDSALKRLLDGLLPDGETVRLQSHLESCGDCQERIEALAYDRHGNPLSIPCPSPRVIQRYLDGNLEDHASDVIGHHTDACRSCGAVLEALSSGESFDEASGCPPVAEWQRLVVGTLPEGRQIALEGHLDGCAACRDRLEALAGGDGLPGRLEALRSAPVADEPGLRRVIGALKDCYQAASAATESFPASGAVPPAELLELLDAPSSPGDLGTIGTYRVLEVLGSGGMGVVLRGFDPGLNRPVAIKVLAPQLATSGTARQRFAREARAAAAIRNEHVVAIHSVDEWRGLLPYLVMEFIPGRSLQARIEDPVPLDVNAILRIGMQAATGLAAAHAQGLVHRDIKPSNILLENCVERVKITDFGLARAADDASLTHSGFVAGTPLFMAPEQARGDAIDHRADLFSLGVVLYAMCTGRSPFRASTTLAVLKRVCDDLHRPIRETNPDIPDSLCRVIDRLLAKEPSDRFSSADEVARVLADRLAARQRGAAEGPDAIGSNDPPAFGQSLVDHHDVGPEKEMTRSRRSPRRFRSVATILVGLAALAVVAFAVIHAIRWIRSGVMSSREMVAPLSRVIVRLPDRSFEVWLNGRQVDPLPNTLMCVRSLPPGPVIVDAQREGMAPGRKSVFLRRDSELELVVSPDGTVEVLFERSLDTSPLRRRPEVSERRDWLDKRVQDTFLSDPEVLALIERIKIFQEEYDHVKRMTRRAGDPAFKAVRQELDRLNEQYNGLWTTKGAEIRGRLKREEGLLGHVSE